MNKHILFGVKKSIELKLMSPVIRIYPFAKRVTMIVVTVYTPRAPELTPCV